MAKPRRQLIATSQAVFEDGALQQVIAEVQEGFVVLRLKGAARGFAPWGAIYHLAVAQEAERELRARRAAIGV